MAFTRDETGVAFPFRRGNQNFPETNTGAQIIVDAVKALLITGSDEVPMGDNLGTNMHGMVFENLNSVTAAIITASVRRIIAERAPKMQILAIRPKQDKGNSAIIIQSEWQIDDTTGMAEVPIQGPA